jgi:phosphatidylserine synthase 1
MVFGCSVLYLLTLQFLIHQDYETVRSLIVWIDPSMQNYTIDVEKEYGQNCWDITFERIWSHFDVFAFAHYWGWFTKALILRHYGICWSVSIMWELTELAFGHLLPNFYECWWDSMVLDVLLCNGLGIYTGMQLCKRLEMREHHWESIKSIEGKKGKIKRALLQFTPESFNSTRWLDPGCSWMRFVSIFQLVFFCQLVELNTFFIKHFFPLTTAHPICAVRLLLISLVGAPTIRQYYTYVTDKNCKRVGTQLWVGVLTIFSELVFNIKFGLKLFSQTEISKMVLWLLINLVISVLGMMISMKIYRWRYGSTILTEKAVTNKTK